MAHGTKTWAERFGRLPDRKPFDKEFGTRNGQTQANLTMFAIIRREVALNLLEQAKELNGRWADEKRRMGCMTLLDATKAFLDAGKWVDALAAAQTLKAHMQKNDIYIVVDTNSMQEKVVAVAGWKPFEEIGSIEAQRTIAEAKTITCEFVESKSQKAVFQVEINAALKMAGG